MGANFLGLLDKFLINLIFSGIVFIKAEHKSKTCSQFPPVLLCKLLYFSLKLDFSRIEKASINHTGGSKNAHRTNLVTHFSRQLCVSEKGAEGVVREVERKSVMKTLREAATTAAGAHWSSANNLILFLKL